MKESSTMTTTPTIRCRRLVLFLAIAAAASAAQPRRAAAQWVVFDPANLGQAVADQVTRIAQYALQGLEYAEAVQTVVNLAEQIRQLDETFTHLQDAANGRIGQLTTAFRQLSAADASTLLDADFGSWKSRLSGSSQDIADALAGMDGESLSSFLLDDLADAADINVGALRGLFPDNPQLGDSMAGRWERGRERGDRIRAADLATAEAAGRVTTLLRAAQIDIDGRKGQGALSHTALQQAQIANQLTAAEMQVALAQLEAVRSQQDAIARVQAEALDRELLALWVAMERAAQQRAATYLASAEGRRGAWQNARVGRLAPIR